MKKIFYIILVIVALMVISRFVKEGRQENTAPTTVVEAIDVNAVGDAEIAAPDEEIVEETIVDGVDDNGMEEETVLDIEETAPAANETPVETPTETPAAE